MAKFSGAVGFCKTEETSPGVWENITTEKKYQGDVVNALYKRDSSEYLNDNVNISNQISIVANRYAIDNMAYMTYIVWNGLKWKIKSVNVQYPRMILQIGDEYNE